MFKRDKPMVHVAEGLLGRICRIGVRECIANFKIIDGLFKSRQKALLF